MTYNEVWFCTKHGVHTSPCCGLASNIGWWETFNITDSEDEIDKKIF